MSTKIYNGYRLPQMSLKELDLFVKKVRKEIKKTHIKLGESMLIRRAVQLLDMYFIYGEEQFSKLLKGGIEFNPAFSPQVLAYFELDNKAKEAEQSVRRIDSEFDFKTSICLFPIRGKILVMLFTQQEAFKNTWSSIEGVEPYPYWNNTDRPEDISPRQWDRRRRDWNAALPGIGIPYECGFIVELVSGFPSLFEMDLEAKEAEQYIGSLNKRAEFYAQNIIFNEKFKESLGADEKDAIEVCLQTRKWLTGEGKEKVSTKAEELKKILLPEITLQLLKEDFNNLKNIRKEIK